MQHRSLLYLSVVQHVPHILRTLPLQVAHLKDRYRCVTTDLPGFGREDPPKWGHSFDDITSRLENTIEAVGNGEPVLLVAHDWGCLFAYMLEKKRPDLVHKLVALDIGGGFSFWPSLSGLFIVMYQAYLILAFLVGGPIGNAMTSVFCRYGIVPPACPNVARSSVCYVYFQYWKTLITGTTRDVDVGPYIPRCPVLFMYGTTGFKRWTVRIYSM